MINIKIQNNRIAVDSYPSLSAGAVNDFEISFRFVDSGWDDLTKIAVFTAGTTAIRVALENDKCFIPADVLEESGDITIGVYGYEMGDNEEVALRKSPTPLEISVWNGSYNKNATDPTPEQVDICEQALQTAQNAETTAQSVRDDADAGAFDGEDGVSVSNANIDEYGDLIMSMSNGQSVNAGNVLPALQNKTITPSEIPQTAVADDGYYALGSVSVEPIEVEELETITENGTYTADEGKYFKEVTVDVDVNEAYYSSNGRSYTKTVNIPDTVVNIGMNLYQNCTFLENLILPNTLLTIGERAFQGCSHLKNFTIPSSLQSITTRAFSECKSLTEVVFPNITISLSESGTGEGVFASCTSLITVSMPHQITSARYTFINCSKLENVIFPFGYVGQLGDATGGSAMFQNCIALKSIEIPSGTTGIGGSCFQGCRTLSTVSIPASVTAISSTAFLICSSLKNITLGNGFLATVKFSASTRFTADDMVSMFNSLGTVPSGETRTFTLGATNLNKLTSTQKAIATDKGWTLA